MALRQFTRLEQIGIVMGIMVIGTFMYLKFFSEPIEKKHKRVERDWILLSNEVKDLKAQAEIRNIRKSIRRLNGRVDEARKDLRRVEVCLSKGVETDAIANEIVRAASGCRLLVKDFGPIEKPLPGTINPVGKGMYERRYYKILLKGRFVSLLSFIEKINHLPKLVTVEKINILKIEKERFMKAEMILAI